MTDRRGRACAATALAVAACLTACTGSDGDNRSAAPLPVAYPRVFVYPDSFTTHIANGVGFDLNAGADVTVDGANVVARYPRYGATLYMAVNTDVEDLDGALDGRRERVALNLHGTPAEQAVRTAANGDSAVIVTALSTAQTPVQFIVVNRQRRTLVNGAFFMTGWTETTPYDSIHPVIDALSADARRLLSSLTYSPTPK